MVSQYCEYTKCHWFIHFTIANFMLCVFHLNKKLKSDAVDESSRSNVCQHNKSFRWEVKRQLSN